MFFVFLRIRMRTMVMKISALLLVIWYCMSIIGFDVHTCRESGRSFVTSSILGTECEDIHPEHHHDHCCSDCGNHASSSEVDCVSPEDCCTDDIQVLVLTGSSTNDSHRHYDECHCGLCPCVIEHMSVIDDLRAGTEFQEIIPLPDSGLFATGDVQTILGVWRI